MNIHIEPIKEIDFDELIELFHEFAAFENASEKMKNSVERMKKEKDFFHGFVAKDDHNNIVGYVTYFFAYYTWTGKALYMDDLYIKVNNRGQNIGTRLIKKVISHAKEKNCNSMRWQVTNWNEPAIQFYEKLGAQINRVEMNCDLTL